MVSECLSRSGRRPSLRGARRESNPGVFQPNPGGARRIAAVVSVLSWSARSAARPCTRFVGSMLPRPYHFRARIQSFQTVAAPFPGDWANRLGSYAIGAVSGRRPRRSGRRSEDRALRHDGEEFPRFQIFQSFAAGKISASIAPPRLRRRSGDVSDRDRGARRSCLARESPGAQGCATAHQLSAGSVVVDHGSAPATRHTKRVDFRTVPQGSIFQKAISYINAERDNPAISPPPRGNQRCPPRATSASRDRLVDSWIARYARQKQSAGP